jgi:hypothetical protein
MGNNMHKTIVTAGRKAPPKYLLNWCGLFSKKIRYMTTGNRRKRKLISRDSIKM